VGDNSEQVHEVVWPGWLEMLGSSKGWHSREVQLIQAQCSNRLFLEVEVAAWFHKVVELGWILYSRTGLNYKVVCSSSKLWRSECVGVQLLMRLTPLEIAYRIGEVWADMAEAEGDTDGQFTSSDAKAPRFRLEAGGSNPSMVYSG
jgi:hypothetical protein